MGLTITGLSKLNDEKRRELLMKSIVGEKTLSMISMQDGVKYKSPVIVMDTDVVFQTGGCALTPNGATTITNRWITVSDIAVAETICAKYIEQYGWVLPGSSNFDLPSDMDAAYRELKAMSIAKEVDRIAWQGDTTSLDNNLAKADGLLKIIDAEASVINATPSTINKTNIRGIVQEIYELIPYQVLYASDLYVFAGYDTIRTYSMALGAANLFHIQGQVNNGEIAIENTNIKMIGVPGLTGTNRIIAARSSNLRWGTDTSDEYKTFNYKVLESNEARFEVQFKLGFQIAIPSEIVEYHNV